MELRNWAIRILEADTLSEKLYAPPILTDHQPGPALFWKEPVRPTNLKFQPYHRKDKLPSKEQLFDKDQRAYCLHRFASHELLAVEIMAYALLAYPDAPPYFRRGVANTLKEEQEHVRLYQTQMNELGLAFGDFPLFKHFWTYTPHLQTPAKYVSVMSLTFEMANLDYAPIYGRAFAEYGDFSSAKLMERILLDEISHVSFGWNWLKKLKNSENSQWDAWKMFLPKNLPPKRAMGKIFCEENRIAAGISLDWLKNFKDSLGIKKIRS